jgi:uncharacterized protein YggE
MRNALRLLPLVFATAAFVLAAACSEKKESLRTRLLVTGESESKAAPDTAVIVLSVVTQSKGALDAQQQNARKSEAVIQAVKQSAGASPDVKTSDYTLEPQRDWFGGLPHIKGYEAHNTVTVTTQALDNVGAIIDAATQAGANSVEGVSFILREGNQAHGQALADASKQAMTKAQAMAQSLGGRITRVVEEREGNFPEQLVPTAEMGIHALPDIAASSANTSTYMSARRTPVEAGSLDVHSQVYLIVEVETNP